MDRDRQERDHQLLRHERGLIPGKPVGRGEWLLSRTVDANGNSISYTYRKKQGQFGSQELVLSSINYTGHDGAKGAYTVTFTGLEGRPDATTDGRLGF